jgi:thymidine phosphorylase
MVRLSKSVSEEEARALVTDSLQSGKALETMKIWIGAQGGDPSYIDSPDKFGDAEFSLSIRAKKDGYIERINAEQVGIASVVLGAGRSKKEDEIDHQAGIILSVKPGDRVSVGDVIVMVSDGVTQGKEECPWLFDLLRSQGEDVSIERLADLVVKYAKGEGCSDDISVLIVKIA